MQYKITEKLLLFIANWLDYNDRWNWKNIGAMPDDHRLHRHRKWLINYLENKNKRKKLYSTLQNLRRRGFIKKVYFKNLEGFIITKKGEQKVLTLKFKNLNKTKLKDNSWIMVIFDIPEKLRKSRDIFRKNLHLLGFEQLQKSVWITPYDVINELKKLINNFGLRNFIKFLLVKELQNE